MEILRESQYLRHGQYGLGVVTQSNAERTTIDFEQHGIKKFVTSLLVVELLPGHAPARPTSPARRSAKKAKKTP
jgi:hypothetical protein